MMRTTMQGDTNQTPDPLLTEREIQILLWLLHTPMQRIGDVAAGLGISRVIVVRCLSRLMEKHLVEQVTPAVSIQQKHAWMYLTNRGIYQAAAFSGSDPVSVARAGQADEPHLLAMLPRFHQIVLVQTMVDDLISAASSFSGWKAQIRWGWILEENVTFRAKKHAICCEANAAVVLCRRYPHEGRQTPSPDESVCALLFYVDVGSVGFTEHMTMYGRLRNLLLYRESSEGQFPFVVVLVESPRQMELWQQAAVEAARKLRIGSELSGVIINVASEARLTKKRWTALRKERPDAKREEVSSIWAYRWRSLSANRSCRLQDSISLMPYGTVPPGIFSDLGDGLRTTQKKQYTLVRGRYQERLKALSFESGNLAKERELVALLGLQMSDRYRSLLLLLYANPLLSTSEAALFVGLTRPTAVRYLFDLQKWGCMCAVSGVLHEGRRSTQEPRENATSQEPRWFLSERGLRYLAASENVSLSTIFQPIKEKKKMVLEAHSVSDDSCEADAPSDREQESDVSTLLGGNRRSGANRQQRSVQHLAGVYHLVAAFYTAAQKSKSMHWIRWFETGPRCVRRYRVSGVAYLFRPDAMLEYLVQTGNKTSTLRFLCCLEWCEGGRRNESKVKKKLQSYALYLRSHAWRRDPSSGAHPLLMMVVKDRGQFERVCVMSQEVVADSQIRVCLTIQSLFDEQGPHGKIWFEVQSPVVAAEAQALHHLFERGEQRR